MVKENKCLNFLKGLSCLIVVLLHCPISGIVGDGIIYAFRFPVPVFFMISGYFCYQRDLLWIRKTQIKILKLLLWSELFCGVISFICSNESISEQVRNMLLWKHPIRTFFCGTLFNGTLWYLYAMFWTWLILFLIKRLDYVQRSYILIPVLLAIHILGRLYIQRTNDINVWICLFRSAILYGVPFVLLGHFLAEKEEWLKSHVSIFHCAFLMVVGGLAIIFEYFIWHCFMDIWLSTILIAIAMFLFAILRPEAVIIPGITEIGKKYSMIIYVSHIPISRIMGKYLRPNMESIYDLISPFIVMAVALAVAKVAYFIKCCYFNRIKRQ